MKCFEADGEVKTLMETELVAEMLADLNMMQLSAREDFIVFCHCKTFKTYAYCNFLYTSSSRDLAYQNMV
jgi:hypothetical protein